MPEGPFPAQQAAGKGAGGEAKVKLFSLRLLGLGFRLLLPGFLLQPVVKESGQEEEKEQANREVLFLDPEERAGREILKAQGHEAFIVLGGLVLPDGRESGQKISLDLFVDLFHLGSGSGISQGVVDLIQFQFQLCEMRRLATERGRYAIEGKGGERASV